MEPADKTDDQTLTRLVRLDLALDEFLDTLEALGDVIDVGATHLEELDSIERRLSDFINELKGVPEERRDAVVEEFRKLEKRSSEGEPLSISAHLAILAERFPNELWVDRLWSSYFRVSIRQRRTELLYRSLLVSLVGAFEVLLGSLLAYFFSARPAALSGQDGVLGGEKEFSLSDLEQAGSIEDARDLAIARRVEAFLYESFDSWSRWFEKHLHFGFSEVCVSWPTLRELIERRHVVVHNGSRVSRRYRSNLGITAAEPKIGTHLGVDQAYLINATSELRVLGILLTQLTRIKLDVEHAEEAVAKLHGESYSMLRRADWPGAQALCQAGLRLKVPQTDLLLFKVNAWIARAYMDEDIAKEVESFDFSALAPRFRLARAALLDDPTSVFDLLEESLKAGELPLEALFDWPLLERIRSHERFRRFLNEFYSDARRMDSDSARRYSEVVLPSTGDKFHDPLCRYAPSDGIPVPRKTASEMRLAPCRVCRP